MEKESVSRFEKVKWTSTMWKWTVTKAVIVSQDIFNVNNVQELVNNANRNLVLISTKQFGVGCFQYNVVYVYDPETPNLTKNRVIVKVTTVGPFEHEDFHSWLTVLADEFTDLFIHYNILAPDSPPIRSGRQLSSLPKNIKTIPLQRYNVQNVIDIDESPPIFEKETQNEKNDFFGVSIKGITNGLDVPPSLSPLLEKRSLSSSMDDSDDESENQIRNQRTRGNGGNQNGQKDQLAVFRAKSVWTKANVRKAMMDDRPGVRLENDISLDSIESESI